MKRVVEVVVIVVNIVGLVLLALFAAGLIGCATKPTSTWVCYQEGVRTCCAVPGGGTLCQ